MENNNSRDFYIRTYLYKCFYVCPAFFKSYPKLGKAHAIFARFQGSEGLVACQSCLKHIRQRVTEDKSFF